MTRRPDLSGIRALWVWHAIGGRFGRLTGSRRVLAQGDPRMREQAMRMLGRDCRENGRVEYKTPKPSSRRLRSSISKSWSRWPTTLTRAFAAN